MTKARITRIKNNTQRGTSVCILKKCTNPNFFLNILNASENGDRERISRSS